MSALTDEQIASLKAIAEASQQLTDSDREGCRLLADMLRGHLPGLDDVTIGRVLFAVAAAIKDMNDIAPHMRIAVLGGLVMGAGLDLTAIEWQEAPRG